MTTPMAPAALALVLELRFPSSATCWSQATDEVRDMSRFARETLMLSEQHAVNFRRLSTPGDWNYTGNWSIIRFYTMMNEQQRAEFLEFASALVDV